MRVCAGRCTHTETACVCVCVCPANRPRQASDCGCVFHKVSFFSPSVCGSSSSRGFIRCWKKKWLRCCHYLKVKTLPQWLMGIFSIRFIAVSHCSWVWLHRDGVNHKERSLTQSWESLQTTTKKKSGDCCVESNRFFPSLLRQACLYLLV